MLYLCLGRVKFNGCSIKLLYQQRSYRYKNSSQFSNIKLQDKILQDFINLTSQKNIVIFICTVFDSKISTREKQIDQLLQLINNNLRVGLFSACGYTSLLTVAEQIRNHENVLLDLSLHFADSLILQ